MPCLPHDGLAIFQGGGQPLRRAPQWGLNAHVQPGQPQRPQRWSSSMLALHLHLWPVCRIMVSRFPREVGRHYTAHHGVQSRRTCWAGRKLPHASGHVMGQRRLLVVSEASTVPPSSAALALASACGQWRFSLFPRDAQPALQTRYGGSSTDKPLCCWTRPRSCMIGPMPRPR